MVQRAITKEISGGHVKAHRDDWLDAARDLLIEKGVDQVKVLTIGRRLAVSRSSFYWYFSSRQHLLDTLLSDWERTNTQALIEHANLPAQTITGAVANLFRCFLDPDLFNPRLDFAVREWARRDRNVRQVIDRADKKRHAAIAAMFRRFDYGEDEAEVRARILYFMQIGYYALDLAEPLAQRLALIEGYLLGFTGQTPGAKEVQRLREYALSRARG